MLKAACVLVTLDPMGLAPNPSKYLVSRPEG